MTDGGGRAVEPAHQRRSSNDVANVVPINKQEDI
jgi:hypothetical protein